MKKHNSEKSTFCTTMVKTGTIFLFFFILTLFSGSSLHAQEPSKQVKANSTTSEKSTEAKLNPNASENSTSTSVNPPDDDSTSLYDTVKQGGLLMIPIILLAILGLTLIIERFIFFFKSKAFSREVLDDFLQKASETSDAQYREELEDELHSKAQVYFNRLEKGMALLNGVGNLAPLVGFFGTVVGMISAFAAIAAATTVNAKVVAVGIQIALVTTAGGLSVAVPVLAAYHFFNHIIQKSYAQADEVIDNLARKLRRMSQSQ